MADRYNTAGPGGFYYGKLDGILALPIIIPAETISQILTGTGPYAAEFNHTTEVETKPAGLNLLLHYRTQEVPPQDHIQEA